MKMKREERQYLLTLQSKYLRFNTHPILEKYHKKALNDLVHRNLNDNFPIISRRYILLYVLGCIALIKGEEGNSEYMVSNLFDNVDISVSQSVREKSKYAKETILNLCKRRGPISLEQRCRCAYFLNRHSEFRKEDLSHIKLLEQNERVWERFCFEFKNKDWKDTTPRVVSEREIEALRDMIRNLNETDEEE